MLSSLLAEDVPGTLHVGDARCELLDIAHKKAGWPEPIVTFPGRPMIGGDGSFSR